MKLERGNFDEDIPHRISATFANGAYRPELIDQSALSSLSELNWIFHDERMLLDVKYDISLHGLPGMGIYFQTLQNKHC